MLAMGRGTSKNPNTDKTKAYRFIIYHQEHLLLLPLLLNDIHIYEQSEIRRTNQSYT
jgi:hypothetical protein